MYLHHPQDGDWLENASARGRLTEAGHPTTTRPRVVLVMPILRHQVLPFLIDAARQGAKQGPLGPFGQSHDLRTSKVSRGSQTKTTGCWVLRYLAP